MRHTEQTLQKRTAKQHLYIGSANILFFFLPVFFNLRQHMQTLRLRSLPPAPLAPPAAGGAHCRPPTARHLPRPRRLHCRTGRASHAARIGRHLTRAARRRQFHAGRPSFFWQMRLN
jgi:hypothetical protein